MPTYLITHLNFSPLLFQAECRDNITRLLPKLDFGRSESAVRINSIDTEYAAEDLKAVFSSKTLPKALMVPKVEERDQLVWVCIFSIFLS